MSRSLSLTLLAIIVALFAARPSVSAAAPGGDFLAVSDIHFDALADPALVDRLAAASAGDWPALFARSAVTPPSRFGQDTNWPLLRAALQAMRAAEPHPAFLLVPGDFLAHAYRQRFDKSAGQPSEAAYRAFVVKSIQFVAGQLQAAFPDTPVLPVLGNNDSDCGDYQLQPDGPFLRDTLPIVRGLLRSGLGSDFAADWTALGNYNVAHPTLPGVRVVFADTVFFSRRYRNACGGGDPAAQTLDWLRTQLERARGDGGKVWLIYHIPPGIDAFATASKHRCPGDAVPMWEAADASRFAALAHEYADVIAASFAGHTHRDEFRLTGSPGRRDGFVLIVPALSPIYDQNPAFQVFGYGAGGDILDVATHYVANLESADDAPLDWQTEPSFTAAWHLPRLDLTTLETLQERIGSDREAGTAWLLRYGVSRAALWPLGAAQGLVPDDTFRAYSCAIGNDSVAAYQACRCGPR